MQESSKYAKVEKNVLDFWQEAKIFEQSVDRPSEKGDYVFYDGPPFATGTPHYGHLVSTLLKDIVPRYYTMKGYRVERRWGWDCHGLPIENIVEKELNIKQKKDIEEMGVGKFNELCRANVLTYVDDWERVIARFGRWADMKNAYRTMDLDFMESVWWVFKELWDKDLIYKAHRSMHICTRCETTLAQYEVSEGYLDIKDLSATVKFPIEGEADTYILAWTTTPWTLIANVALAVGEEIDYLKVKASDGNYYILAKERLADIFSADFEIVAEFKGRDLLGKPYQPLFDYYASDESLANRERGWKIYGADFVSTDEGTGVVHIAPAFGEDDMRLGKDNNLPFIQHVGMDGLFYPEVKDFPGLHVKPQGDHMATDVEIIKYLAARDFLFSKAKYEHNYPHCWRCDTPLINYATSSLFVDVTAIKDQLLESAKEINWFPKHIKEGRFGNWLEGARDWSISRQRFWATAIPIWECDCGEKKVISSVAELEELSGEKFDDIHKDKIDHVTFPCPKCSQAMKRIPDVIDCWFESGSMPYAQWHYPFENKEKVEKNFPAQFIAEGVDQTRAWFYYLHVISGGIRNSHAFENVITNGIVLAEDGKKMSKRLKNYPDPSLLMEKYSSDALRMQLIASPVLAAENLNFSEKETNESLRKNVILLGNIFNYYDLYASNNPELDLAEEGIVDFLASKAGVLDKWIIFKFNDLLATVDQGFTEYNLPRCARAITVFISDLSTWYLRRSRDRFKSEDLADRQAALATTKLILIKLSKLVAPFMPFIAEDLWQKLSQNNFTDQKKSVHLEAWPELISLKADNESQLKEEIIGNMDFVLEIVELGLMKRNEAGIKIKQKLNKATIFSNEKELSADYANLITDELNLNQIEFKEARAEQVLDLELDTEITPELRQEGLRRELVRLINSVRKEGNLSLGDMVATKLFFAPGVLENELPDLALTLEKYQTHLSEETHSTKIVILEKSDSESEGLENIIVAKDLKIEGQDLRVELIKN